MQEDLEAEWQFQELGLYGRVSVIGQGLRLSS